MLKFLFQLVFVCLLLGMLAAPAFATDISIDALALHDNRFTGLPGDQLGTLASATNNSTSVTLTTAHGFQLRWTGMVGLRISLAGVDYTCTDVTYDQATTTGTFVLSSAYAASTASVAWKVYSFAVLRIFANRSFQPAGKSYIVQQGALNTNFWYKQLAVPIVAGTAYIPATTLDATTDAVNTTDRGATYTAAFFTPSGGYLKTYDCFTTFAVPKLPTSTSWGALCSYNTSSTPVLPDQSVYSKTQVNSLLQAICGTTCTSFNVGSSTASSGNDIYLLFSSDTNKAGVRLHLGHMQFSDDGLVWANIDQTVTPFSLNSQTGAVTLTTDSANNDITVTNNAGTITLSFPTASASKRGVLSTTDWSTFNAKIGGSGTSGYVPRFTAAATLAAGLLQDNGTSLVKQEGGSTAQVFRVSNFDNTVNPSFNLTRGKGSVASPTGVVSTTILGQLTFGGQYDTTVGHITPQAEVRGIATETWDATHQGTELQFFSNAVGSAGYDTPAIGIRGLITRFYNASADYVTLEAPTVATTHPRFKLPGADGTSGQALTTDGSGNWSFTSLGGAISGLTTNFLPKATGATTIADSVVKDVSGKVGLGVTAQTQFSNYAGVATDPAGVATNATNGLHWDMTATGYAVTVRNQNNATSANGLYIQTTNTNGNTTPLALAIGSAFKLFMGGDGRLWVGRNLGTSFTGGDSDFHVQSDGSTSSTFAAQFDNASTHVLAVRNDGRVGVMTNAPSYELHVNGSTGMKHLIGTSNTPGIAAGTGAGTSPTIAISGNDLAMHINITPGSTPATSATVVTVTYATAFGTAPKVFCVPTNSDAAALSGNAQVYVDVASLSTTVFVLKVGSTALTQSTTYKFSCTAIQ